MSMTNLKNHWNTLKICLFGQTTKQRQTILNPEILENTSNFEGWGLTLVAYKKISLHLVAASKRAKMFV